MAMSAKVEYIGLEELQQIAANFGLALKGGEQVAMVGDLGAGKTTFVRALIQALKPGQRVQSPTFTVLQEYEIGGTVPMIVHIDAYRFTTGAELAALELEAYPKGTVVIIEWPERLEGTFEFTHEIRIDHAGEKRDVEIIEF